MNDAIRYGLNKETEARKHFVVKFDLIVHQVGLVVSMKQPFLACSGLVFDGEDLQLLEIKCPYTCEKFKTKKYSSILRTGGPCMCSELKKCHFNRSSACRNIKGRGIYTDGCSKN